MTAPAPTQEQIRTGWESVAAGFDEYVTPQTLRLAEPVLDRVSLDAGSRLLDVATGSGALAIPAARRGARVTAVDIAPTMIERLRARAAAEELSGLDARVMDGQALDLADDTFDVSASLNGVSLFPDLPRGLAELVRVTRPGGQVAIGAFGPIPKSEFIAFFFAAMQATAPDLAQPTGPLPPFRLADPDVLRQQLTAAGLSGVRVETVTVDTPFESAAHLWKVVTSSNPIGAQLAARLAPQQQEQARQVLDGMLRERSGGLPDAVLHADVNIGTGRK